MGWQILAGLDHEMVACLGLCPILGWVALVYLSLIPIMLSHAGAEAYGKADPTAPRFTRLCLSHAQEHLTDQSKSHGKATKSAITSCPFYHLTMFEIISSP